jgi:hypothetical protein
MGIFHDIIIIAILTNYNIKEGDPVGPKSKYNEPISRDKWMARSIEKIFKKIPFVSNETKS